ncbi:MAG TPA: elongation factor G [Candidatus Eubacterium faecale]|uniref:Elongation factor G n=1 Tax=Candidatus Eubacterium faecale TaxID=2838568 RepID=A0A9D2S956_9FIRM|nr:elongation factor G [Candidatus Eubacterium faecale]
MKIYDAQNIRNIVLAGHASKGKTTLAEALLSAAGATERLGKVEDGTAVMDYDAEEKKRKISVSCAVAPVEYKGKKINILDTPGLFDFAEGAAEGIRAAETALIVVSARSGLAVGAEKAFKNAGSRRMAKIFVTTKMDDERADFYKAFNAMAAKFGTSVCPVVIPVLQNGKVAAYYNMIDGKAYAYDGFKSAVVEVSHDDAARFDAIHEVFNEAVAGTDEEIMEKYFAGEELTKEDRLKGLRIGVADGSIIPVFALSGISGAACDMLLDFIADVCPAPKSEYAISGDEPVELSPDPNGPLAAVCFKTVADPFIGKLSFFKVLSGKITPNSAAYNERTGKEERMGKIVTMFGAKQIDCPEIPAGDIGAVVKLSGFNTGDTLCSADKVIRADGVATPNPTYSMAVKAVKKGDEEKIASGFSRLCEEDPSLEFSVNNETHEQIIKGLGEQQIDVAVAKLRSKFSVDVELSAPKIAYRETITKKVSAQGRHKKQSGGHGQFGDVFIEFEPSTCDKLEFAERIVGGSVPKNFFPAVEKGLNECMEKGVLAGYPMVGIKATLYDGSYHPVDSSEMSFKMAASLAFKEGVSKASPILLEPIMTVKVTCNDDAMGDVIGDINKRRGRVLGMTPSGDGMQEILSEIPQAEMATFSTAMRQITQGRGSFESEFARYERCPEHIAQKIISESENN